MLINEAVKKPRNPEFIKSFIFGTEKNVSLKSLHTNNWTKGSPNAIRNSKEQAEKQIIPNDLFKGILSKESREIDPILFESVSFLLKISKRITKINKIPANLAPLK